MRVDDALPSRDRPLAPGWTVREGLDAFLRENGYDVAHYDAPRTPAKVLGIRFSVPNPPRHRWAIMRHDLHHVVTGYGTDLAGEAEVSAWELRRGIGPLGLYVGSIVVSAVLMGCVVSPRRMVRAWSASRKGGSLFHDNTDYQVLLTMSIGELRARLDVPADGLARGTRGLNGLAPRR